MELQPGREPQPEATVTTEGRVSAAGADTSGSSADSAASNTEETSDVTFAGGQAGRSFTANEILR